MQIGIKQPAKIGATLLAVTLFIASVLDRLFPLTIPDTNKLNGAVVLARDGTPLRAFADENGVWRYTVTPEQVSPLYLEALLTYEDRWYYYHTGVNPIALIRAASQMLFNRRVVSGGSTLTMQVARMLHPCERSLSGKLKQLFRAVQLEAHFSKRDILTLYLNNAPFGGAIQGVQAASYAYLGKPANRLSRAEAALLTVLPQSPSRRRPDRHPAMAQLARDKVLARMRDMRIWSAADVADAQIEHVSARRLVAPMKAALLAERLHASAIDQSTITTTIDASLQDALESNVSAYLSHLPERTSAALLVVDNDTLQALAYVGSAAFGNEARLGDVDMVQAWRSPGSTLKPFLYGMALDAGLIHSESLLLDAPQSFGGYRPGNFNEAFNGPIGAAQALRLSLNVPAVDLLDRVTPAHFVARLANAGLPLQMPKGAEPNLSIILGGAGARLEDLVGAYTAFNRGGVAGHVRLTPNDPVIDRQVLSSGAAWIVRQMLEANSLPGLSTGTFDSKNHAKLAWKTGTSYGFRDSWAIGTTRHYTAGVWIGRPDGTPLPGQYGAITALPLLVQTIERLPRSSASIIPSPAPASVTEAEICWPLGLAYDAEKPDLCHQKHHAWILNGVIPPTLPERDSNIWSAGVIHVHMDAKTGTRISANCNHPQTKEMDIARWPALAYPWLSTSIRKRATLPPLAADCGPDALANTQNLHISGINQGATIARAPDSDTPARLSLRALGADGPVLWLIDQRLQSELDAKKPFEPTFPETGIHTITALTRGGSYAQVEIQVLR